jgi:spermidine synthase
MALLIPSDRLATLLPGAQGGRIVFYEEGGGGTVAVVERSTGANRFRRLYIQGVSNSGDAMPSLRYMRLQALLPLIMHTGEPRSALVIGYGTGITAGALSRFPALTRRVAAELLPAVVHATSHFQGTYDAASDPGLEIRFRDGRRELQASTEQYDFITLEPPPPSAAGVANLYSTEFYGLANARLNQHGILAQWLPLATQNEHDTKALVASFLAVFPYASLWTTELHETLLVGSQAPLVLDVPRIKERFALAAPSEALREVGIASPEALLATWMMGRDGLVQFAGNAPPVTDDWPAIEYADWVRPGEFARVFASLLELQTEPPLQGADAEYTAAVAAERERLDAFYSAGLVAYSGDCAAWASIIGRVARSDGNNPYYGWFIGPARP